MKMKKAQARIGPDLAALRILIVDDEADIRLGLTQLMESMGIQVSQAATGHEALQWLEQNEAEIVLTDLMIPGMSGAELLTEVKQLSPQIVVVIGFASARAWLFWCWSSSSARGSERSRRRSDGGTPGGRNWESQSAPMNSWAGL